MRSRIAPRLSSIAFNSAQTAKNPKNIGLEESCINHQMTRRNTKLHGSDNINATPIPPNDKTPELVGASNILMRAIAIPIASKYMIVKVALIY